MAFPQIPGRPAGEIRPLENQVPDQGDVGPRAMLPLVPAREQQDHDVLQHAGLGHGQHDDIDMNLDNMLPLQQVFNLDQQDDMLEDGNQQLREQISPHIEMVGLGGSSHLGKGRLWTQNSPMIFFRVGNLNLLSRGQEPQQRN